MIRIVAKRYAKALVQLAEEQKAVDKTRADMAAVAGAVREQPVLRKLFASPVFSVADKKAVIGELAAKLGMQQATRRFIEHLAETGRIRYVAEVHEAFLEILAERQNRAVARLTTAAAVSPADLAEIAKKLETLTGRKVDVDAQVDPALIGGAKAQIGSVVYDGSIRNQLDKMKRQLVKQ